MSLVRIKKADIKENLDFAIYNYLAVAGNITTEKMIQDFKSIYDIDLRQEDANRILVEYLKSGVLSPRFRYFVFLSY